MRIGLTGGIGSGKSFIAKILECMDYPVFYSDQVAKEIWTTDEEFKTEVIDLLGAESYLNGQINKAFVAEKIFNNPSTREQLNRLIHPKVRLAYDQYCESFSFSTLVFNEAAILFETGAYQAMDANILVTAPMALRIQRVMQRDHLSEREVQTRINNQWSDEQKSELADQVIHNDEKQPLLIQIERAVHAIRLPSVL